MNNRVKRLILFAQAVAGDIKALKLKIGNTDTLVTDDKTSTVNAINEVAGSSKEIKDSIEKFKTEIGINSEIATANNISVNPFELLVPFIKNQISNGQTSDNEYSETVYYIPSQPHVIKSILNGKLSSNVGFKIKQGTFEKFVHFASPIEDNFELPTEIDTSKEYTINEYDVFGHYLRTYKVVPYVDFIKKEFNKKYNAETQISEYFGNNFLHSNTLYQTKDNFENIYYDIIKNGIDNLSPINVTIQAADKIYINTNANKFYNMDTKTWDNLNVFNLQNLADKYLESTINNIIKQDNYNIPIKYFTDQAIKQYISVNNEDLEPIKGYADELMTLNYFERLIIKSDLSKIYNQLSHTWLDTPSELKEEIKQKNKNWYINKINATTNICTVDDLNSTADEFGGKFFDSSSNAYNSIIFTNELNNLDKDIYIRLFNRDCIIFNTNSTKMFDYISYTWKDIDSDIKTALQNKITQTYLDKLNNANYVSSDLSTNNPNFIYIVDSSVSDYKSKIKKEEYSNVISLKYFILSDDATKYYDYVVTGEWIPVTEEMKQAIKTKSNILNFIKNSINTKKITELIKQLESNNSINWNNIVTIDDGRYDSVKKDLEESDYQRYNTEIGNYEVVNFKHASNRIPNWTKINTANIKVLSENNPITQGASSLTTEQLLAMPNLKIVNLGSYANIDTNKLLEHNILPIKIYLENDLEGKVKKTYIGYPGYIAYSPFMTPKITIPNGTLKTNIEANLDGWDETAAPPDHL